MFESNGGRASGTASRLVSGRLAIAAATAAASVGSSAFAVDYVRSATAGNLNLPASWDGLNVPGPADVAVWDAGSYATPNALGADLSWSGIRIGAGEAAAVSISGANVLTLGASGIDMSAAVANLTIQPTPSTATGVNLGAAQTWSVNAGRLLSVANGSGAITGAAASTIAKTGLGSVYFNSGLSSFAGGVTVTQGAVTFNTNTTTSGTTITSGPLGTGTITLNGGTLSVNGTSGRDLSNDVNLVADSTIGLATTNRVRSAGTWTIAPNTTRTLTLTNVGSSFVGSEQFGIIVQSKVFTVASGTLRFAAGANATAATPATINFAASGGGAFTNNSGLTLGQNVTAVLGSTQGNVNSPTLTLESGSALFLSNGSQAKNFTAATLSGAGTVGSGQTDGTTSLATLTLNGATGTGNFTGNVLDVYNAFGSNFTGIAVAVQKTAGATQIFGGTNAYTGATSITGGTLRLASANAQLAATGAVTLGGGTLDSSVANANVGGSTTLGTGAVSAGGSGVGSFTFVGGKSFTMTGGTWAETIASAGSFDQLLGTAGGTFSATAGTLDLSSSAGINYASTYALVGGFSTVAVSGLTITGYDTANYVASLSNAGVLSFASTAVPEPTTLAALAGIATVGIRRRRLA